MWKWTKRIVLVVLLLVVAGGVALYFTIDGIIRSQVEQQSTKSLNLPTKLESANISIFGGKLSLKNYEVASPPGFSADPMLSLGGLDVGVSYSELRGDPVKVQTITIDRPKMLLEHSNGKFNIKAMADNFPQPAPGQPAPPPTEPNPQSGEKLKVTINQISVKEPVVVLRPGLPGMKDITIPIDTFEIKGIGTAEPGQNGVAVKAVVTQLLTTLAAKATKSKDIPEQLRLLLDGDLNAVAQKYIPGEAGKLVGSLLNEKTLKDPGKAISDVAGGLVNQATTNPVGAVDTVKGLLNSGKKDEKKKK
jgi:uncharacterized protein involved in outer membrane biogenesis